MAFEETHCCLIQETDKEFNYCECVFFKFSLGALQTSVCSWRFQLFLIIADSSRLSARCPLCASVFAFPCSQPLLMAHEKIVLAATATRKFFANFVTTVIDIYYQVVFLVLCTLNNRARAERH